MLQNEIKCYLYVRNTSLFQLSSFPALDLFRCSICGVATFTSFVWVCKSCLNLFSCSLLEQRFSGVSCHQSKHMYCVESKRRWSWFLFWVQLMQDFGTSCRIWSSTNGSWTRVQRRSRDISAMHWSQVCLFVRIRFISKGGGLIFDQAENILEFKRSRLCGIKDHILILKAETAVSWPVKTLVSEKDDKSRYI